MLANKFSGSLTKSMHVYNVDLQSLIVDSHTGLINMDHIVFNFMENMDLSQAHGLSNETVMIYWMSFPH